MLKEHSSAGGATGKAVIAPIQLCPVQVGGKGSWLKARGKPAAILIPCATVLVSHPIFHVAISPMIN